MNIPKPKIGQKYWGKIQDCAISSYIKLTDQGDVLSLAKRDRIFKRFLYWQIRKLIDFRIGNKPGQVTVNYIGVYETLDKYKKSLIEDFFIPKFYEWKPEKGRSFTFFTYILRNKLIQDNDKFTREKYRTGDYDEITIDYSDYYDEENRNDVREFGDLFFSGSLEHNEFSEVTNKVYVALSDVYQQCELISTPIQTNVIYMLKELTGLPEKEIRGSINELKDIYMKEKGIFLA